MRQARLLLTSFLVTFAILAGAYVVYLSVTGNVVTPSAAPSAATAVSGATPAAPTLAPTPGPAATPAQTATPTPEPTPEPTLTRTPTPGPTSPTPRPTSAAPISSSPGTTKTVIVTVNGADYDRATVELVDSSSITPLPNGGVAIQTDRTSHGTLFISWKVPGSEFPRSGTIAHIDTAVCGRGSGDFWETYGPSGSDELEYEATPPSIDGCWHFHGAPGPDTTTTAGVTLNSRLEIRQVVYTFTLR
jgi:hypothetical protein